MPRLQTGLKRKREVMETNLYALNRWVIMPSTTPKDQLDDSLRRPYHTAHPIYSPKALRMASENTNSMCVTWFAGSILPTKY